MPNRSPQVLATVARQVLLLRGRRVMLDSDLAALYRVETKALNRAVQRNASRFPRDFMFQLTQKEADSLRCQIGTSKGRGGRRYRPYAFTEHGAVMLANVLRSRRAIAASVIVVRAFIRIREDLATHKRLAQRSTELERRHAGTTSPLAQSSALCASSWPQPSREVDRLASRPTSTILAIRTLRGCRQTGSAPANDPIATDRCPCAASTATSPSVKAGRWP
jgi:hypothetical protein